MFLKAMIIVLLSTGTASAQKAITFTACKGMIGGQLHECVTSAESMRDASRQAARGDYQAMRNVAYCQWIGCDGSIKIDRESSCQWRRAIMRRHYKPGGLADQGDELHLSICVRSGQ